MKIVLLVFSSLLFFSCNQKETTTETKTVVQIDSKDSLKNIYEKTHLINITDQKIEIIKWESEDTLNKAYVHEQIDEEGRTKSLHFYNEKHELEYAEEDYWGSPIIKYTYEPNRIIESFFKNHAEHRGDFRYYEKPFQIVYHISADNQIVDIDVKYKFEFEWKEEQIKEALKILEKAKEQSPENDSKGINAVIGYNYAKAKYKGVHPKK